MNEEVLVNVTPNETRVAMVENGVLQEIHIERNDSRGLVGNIYQGRVCRVLPGMQAAFVDIGLERAAFLHVCDIVSEKGKTFPKNDVNISTLLKEGQLLLVQVVKNPLGSKGARLSTQIAIPSRYLVFMPSLDTVGISQKINGDERKRLLSEVKKSLQEDNSICELLQEESNEGKKKPNNGFIIRTAAENIAGEELQTDMRFLCRLWHSIRERAEETTTVSLVYEDLALKIRVLRDIIGMTVEQVRVDSRSSYQSMSEFATQFMPELHPILEHYQGERPLFDLYNIEHEINKSLKRNVSLKSGGYLVIDQTEAMTTIDVNTGKFVGHRNLEETIFKTNLEATQAIARQIRLRNLGGIIIVDFIDMLEANHRRQVLKTLEKYLEKDHAKVNISDISPLGLVQMTRKRTHASLEQVLCHTCPTCNGRGMIKSTETICYEIFREIIREARQFEAEGFMVYASQTVVDMMLDESSSVADLETFVQAGIGFQVEPFYTQEQYDIVLV